MRTPVSERILTVASGLFFKEGIRTVGIDRIILEASIAKATFYRHFASKEDLVLAYLQGRHDNVMQGLNEVLATEAGARRRIETIFERLQEKAQNPEFRGCAFALAVAEHGESERIVGLARFHKQAVADLLRGIAESAGVRESDLLASHLALLYDGALARRAVQGNASPMMEAKRCALALFDLLAGGAPSTVN